MWWHWATSAWHARAWYKHRWWSHQCTIQLHHSANEHQHHKVIVVGCMHQDDLKRSWLQRHHCHHEWALCKHYSIWQTVQNLPWIQGQTWSLLLLDNACAKTLNNGQPTLLQTCSNDWKVICWWKELILGYPQSSDPPTWNHLDPMKCQPQSQCLMFCVCISLQCHIGTHDT